jgi:EAL domain-containing protein (putative c-di-GMP-specific phosphodiesterase class I)
MDLEELLRDVLTGVDGAGSLEVHYQPIVQLSDRSVIGHEALVRLRRSSGELVMPDAFIEIAEGSGLIRDLGRVVLETACAQHVAWLAAGLPYRTITVNISPRHLAHPDFLTDVTTIVERTGVDISSLCLEVTESSILSEQRLCNDHLRALTTLGASLALDDAGTGWSSLSRLQNLPFDILKIDRSFVSGLGRRARDEHLVRALVVLGHGLGLRVIAEGVENAVQERALMEMGCESGQGYLYGRPHPA